MSNLSELLPAGGGGKNVEFVASGTLGNGATVILNSDGTVTGVGIVAGGLGSASVFESGSTDSTAMVYDTTNNKVVVVYADWGDSGYGKAVVGTISGTTISYGTPVVFNGSGSVSNMSIAFDSTASKVVIAYRGTSNDGNAIVGTVSGTAISFGTMATFNSGSTTQTGATYDTSNDKTVIVFKDSANSGYAASIVGTISGTSISFGTEVIIKSASISYTGVSYDSTVNKVVTTYNSGDTGLSRVGTVSGTSISFGTEATFVSSNAIQIKSNHDPVANKTVIVYRDNSNSSYGTAVVGTVSGTGISFGSATVFKAAAVEFINVVYNIGTGKSVISYRDQNAGSGAYISGTISGTGISFDSSADYSTTAIYNSAAYDPVGGKVVFSFADTSNSNYGTTKLLYPAATNLTSTNFLGITDAAISSGASGSVTIKGGLKSGLSSLTPNSIYYTQGDGSISTVSTSPAVRIGKALSSTTLNLEFSS